MITTAKAGTETLTFGIYALRYFTERMGCGPYIQPVYAAFQGGMLLKAKIEMVRCGLEETEAEKTQTSAQISDYKASKVLNSMTAAEQETAIKAFFSSVLGEDYDTWLKAIEAIVDEVTAPAETVKPEADEPKKSPATSGDTLKKKP